MKANSSRMVGKSMAAAAWATVMPVMAIIAIAPSKATPERSSFSRGSPPRNMPR